MKANEVALGRRYRDWVPLVCKACQREYPQAMALFIRTILEPAPGDAALDYCPTCRDTRARTLLEATA